MHFECAKNAKMASHSSGVIAPGCVCVCVGGGGGAVVGMERDGELMLLGGFPASHPPPRPFPSPSPPHPLNILILPALMTIIEEKKMCVLRKPLSAATGLTSRASYTSYKNLLQTVTSFA